MSRFDCINRLKKQDVLEMAGVVVAEEEAHLCGLQLLAQIVLKEKKMSRREA